MDEELIRCLVTGVQCVNCSACYRDENVTVLGTYQDITFLSVYCPVCNRRDLMAVVLKDEQGIGRATLLQQTASGLSSRTLFDANVPLLPEFSKEVGFSF